MRAERATAQDPDAFDLSRFGRWSTAVRGLNGAEHIALSDGWRRIRLDVVQGSLLDAGPVRLHYLLSGFSTLAPGLLTTRRLVALWQRGDFLPPLFPVEAGLPRRLDALRVGDAVAAGASYREIAVALFGEQRVRSEWRGRSDFLLSRVRRLVADARKMAAGGWRDLLAPRHSERGRAVPAALSWPVE